jgi:hypothetical protein
LEPYRKQSGDSYYAPEVHLGELKISFSGNIKGEDVLVEKQGKFYVNTAGCDFPIEWFEHDYGRWREKAMTQANSEKIRKFFNLWKNLPVKMEGENLQKYISGKLTEADFGVDNTKGVTKAYDNVKTYFENLVKIDKVQALAFRLLLNGVGSTVESVSISTLFNKVFGAIGSEKEFQNVVSRLTAVMMKIERYGSNYLSEVLKELTEARNIKKETMKRRSTGAFNKIMDDLDFVKIDETAFPLTHAAVHGGEIPLGTFFRKAGESYFVYNDNWSLWEEMLTVYPEIAREISAEAARRTTYEKDLMSYFFFVLHKLPEFLEKYTGHKWTGIPKLVKSANELEPPKEGSTGTVKTRSALTPIVDNEKHEVVIPYVSMAVAGYSTSYCYGLDYNILERGFSLLGNSVTEEVELMNGRDQYGLMFYTLTGSDNTRGYPTFLIIFENLENDTIRVHFHRTHPMRSKNRDYNPVHGWIKGCYKWMVGNVNYDRIKAQQGDLAFVQIEEFPEGEISKVNSYDSHCFSTEVKFTPYVKKDNQNVLGYVQLENDTMLNHTEHKARLIPAGNYEIRQCRSWEANPKGIWSLRID